MVMARPGVSGRHIRQDLRKVAMSANLTLAEVEGVFWMFAGAWCWLQVILTGLSPQARLGAAAQVTPVTHWSFTPPSLHTFAERGAISPLSLRLG
jgi:hypothetical protein